MGKNEDDRVLTSSPSSQSSSGGRCRSISKIASLRCVLMVVVGVAVFLPAAFWLLPFLGRGPQQGVRTDPFHGANVVASFRVQKHVSFLNANIARLQYDIFEEIGVPNSSVAVISLEPLGGLNWTSVVFGIWPYLNSTNISSTGLSILRENFMAFAIGQSTLDLTTSLFGKTYFFQVLKFPGGITIIPQQSVFLLQKVDMLFNFTLNFPINKVEGKLGELKAQMKSGLLLSSYENLYVRLTNLKGSTVAPPTIVQTFAVLAVGNRPPSAPRLRQLAQTIRSDENLGLNHTLFGRVKQIQLSSFLNHSLNDGGNGKSIPPTPPPQPQVHHHHHHNHHHHHHHHHFHHHHHHHHHSGMDVAPVPAHQHLHRPPAPCGRHCLSPNKPRSNPQLVAASAPVDSPKTAPSSYPSDGLPALPPTEHLPTPSPFKEPPASAPRSFHTPMPHVFLAHVRAPSKSTTETKPPDKIPSVSPSPFSSAAVIQPFVLSWIFVAVLYSLAHL